MPARGRRPGPNQLLFVPAERHDAMRLPNKGRRPTSHMESCPRGSMTVTSQDCSQLRSKGVGPMSKKSKKSTKEATVPSRRAAEGDPRTAGKPKMKRKDYEEQMRRLQGELVAMQQWVKSSGAKVCIVFEGLDSAGKGGTIRRITERTSPRVFKHIALPTPTEREKSQMYIQRYIAHFPSAGEVAIFDRSWYN